MIENRLLIYVGDTEKPSVIGKALKDVPIAANIPFPDREEHCNVLEKRGILIAF